MMQEGERRWTRAERAQQLRPGSRLSRVQQVRLTRQTYGQRRNRSDLRIGGHRSRGGGHNLQ
jgi:hypothetical protein